MNNSFSCLELLAFTFHRLVHRQSFHAHNFQGIGGGAGTWAQLIIKDHSAPDHILPEVTVGDVREMIRQLYEFQIMGGNQPGAVLTDQLLDVGPAADQPFAIVGALENFVN